MPPLFHHHISFSSHLTGPLSSILRWVRVARRIISKLAKNCKQIFKVIRFRRVGRSLNLDYIGTTDNRFVWFNDRHTRSTIVADINDFIRHYWRWREQWK